MSILNPIYKDVDVRTFVYYYTHKVSEQREGNIVQNAKTRLIAQAEAYTAKLEADTRVYVQLNRNRMYAVIDALKGLNLMQASKVEKLIEGASREVSPMNYPYYIIQSFNKG